METAQACFRRADVLAAMRCDPDLPISLTTSTKSTYTYHERSKQRQGIDKWNNGSRVSIPAQEAEYGGRVKKALASLPGAHSTVRSFHAFGSSRARERVLDAGVG